MYNDIIETLSYNTYCVNIVLSVFTSEFQVRMKDTSKTRQVHGISGEYYIALVSQPQNNSENKIIILQPKKKKKKKNTCCLCAQSRDSSN